ncbi:response regulator [Thermonema rossianum]|jgi:serine phosphatase RsbU (regulator of sigma subunit)|uniref:response regulator n=1 Tax=Thermonema rossianum TaxID=55505 RepID=UPI00056EF2D8|nr:response regulator [Thermonema rossianum]
MQEDRNKHKDIHILYVDDEESNLRIFKTAFKRKYTVHTATSAQEAIDILKEHPIHILITDYKMPQMSGVELLEYTVERYPNLIRMILTGFADIEAIVRAVNKSGIYQYITKPWDRGELEMIIEKAIETLRLRDERERLIEELRQLNTSLEEKVRERTAEVEQLLAKVQSSIRYAQRIQEAMLPSKQELQETIGEHVLFYRPRDIVSGDFYWVAHKTENGEDKTIVVVADCTGHGVPGAMMSMVGVNLIAQAVHDREIHAPGQILSFINQGIIERLRQEETVSRDGMDAVVLCIDRKAQKISLAGGNLGALIIRRGEVEVLKGSRQAIGGYEQEEASFEEINLPYEPMHIYLYTDGFQDQFGGESGKRFYSKNLVNLIEEIHRQPFAMQAERLAHTFDEWKGSLPQVDDVTVLGFRFEP